MDIILDRDGTLIEEEHYLRDPSRVRLIPGAGRAMHRLQEAGARFHLVTNQSGIGRGYFTLDDYLAVQARLDTLLLEHKVRLHGVRFCPHAPEENCRCRKPAIGLWDSLRREYDLDPDRCVMIGDKEADLEFASQTGLKTAILVLTGHGPEEAARLGLPRPKPPENVIRISDQGTTVRFVAASLPLALDWLGREPRP